jgi:hypothetical protein
MYGLTPLAYSVVWIDPAYMWIDHACVWIDSACRLHVSLVAECAAGEISLGIYCIFDTCVMLCMPFAAY